MLSVSGRSVKESALLTFPDEFSRLGKTRNVD